MEKTGLLITLLTIFGIIILALVFDCTKEEAYDIEVVDSTGLVLDSWGSVRNFTIEGDTSLVLKGGEVIYTLKPGEDFNIIQE